MAENEKNEVVLTESETPNDVHVDDIFGSNGTGAMITSDEGKDSFESEMEILELLDGETSLLKDHVNEEIEIYKFGAQQSRVNDINTGNPVDKVRMVLDTSMGRLSTSSESAESRIAQYWNLFKRYDLKISKETPLVVTPKMVTTRSGYQVLTLVLNTKAMASYVKK